MKRATTENDAGQWTLRRDADQVSPENNARLAACVLGIGHGEAGSDAPPRGHHRAGRLVASDGAAVCLCDVEENRRADELALPHKALELEATPV